MIKKILLSLLVVGTIAIASGLVITSRELVGNYRVTGANPDGSKYHGTMTLTLKNGTLLFTGKIGEGQEFYGIAKLVADKLALSYGINQKGSEEMSFINLVLYKVKKTTNRIVLDGIWSYGEGIGQERAEKE